EHKTTGSMDAEITAVLGNTDISTVSTLKITGTAGLNLADCHVIRDRFKTTLYVLDLSSAKFEDNKIPNGAANEGAFSGMKIEDLILPEGLIEIGDRAFHTCDQIIGINLPNSITRIGDYALFQCLVMELQALPTSLQTLGAYAFQECRQITVSELPSGLQGSIGTRTFQNCSKMTFSRIPAGITSLGSYAFRSCSRVETLIFPAGLTSIGNQVFDKCAGLKNIYIEKETPPTLGTTPFSGVSLSDITLYVPIGKKTAFNISPWNEMKNIEEYSPTALPSVEGKTGIRIYPNPVQNELFVRDLIGDNVQFSIIDLTGKQIVTGKLFNNKSIDISSLSEGIYFLKVKNEAFKIVKK
ncbi:MAG: leucine-rich repeat domain-containing protein, partial [Paludibacter sp.]|nr:leucine-rich repeat domain-containing protein [Paludibacter sp.]